MDSPSQPPAKTPSEPNGVATGEEVQAMLAAWKDADRRELLRFLNEQVLREQEIYWTRFAGFGALHAGLLAVLGSIGIQSRSWITRAGFMLGLLWVLVQSSSLWYASRLKKPYHKLRRSMAITFSEQPEFSPATTQLGVLASLLMLGLWTYLLFS